MVELPANSGDPDQMLHSAVYELSLHCLPINLLEVSRLQWVNVVNPQCTKQNCSRRLSIFQYFLGKIRLEISYESSP